MQNKLKRIHYLLIISIALGIFSFGNTQEIANPLPEMQSLYRNLNFVEVINTGRQFLQSTKSVPPADLIAITELMALSFYQMGEIDSASTYFLSLLSIDPKHELDPIQTSPKIIQFYEQLKKEFLEREEKQAVPSYRKYIFLKDPRPAAAWRSAIFPGWGQIFKGQNKKGLVVGGMFSTLFTATVISWVQEKRFHDRYLAARQPADIENKYKLYNNWYKARRYLTVLTFSSWVYAFVDALWTPAILPQASMNRDGVMLYTFRISF